MLLIGWHDAGWPALHRATERGLMPNLRRLIESGSIAALASPQPIDKAAMWTSLATAGYAERHGVGFGQQVRPDRGGVQATGARSWRAPALWEILQANGVATTCVNWPFSGPATHWANNHVDESFAVSTGGDYEHWALPLDCASPPAFRQSLRDLRVHRTDDLAAQMAAMAPGVLALDPAMDERPDHLARALARNTSVHAVATEVAAADDWDVLCVCYDLLDACLTLSAMPGDAVFGSVTEGGLALLDAMLARLLHLVGDGTTVFLVSPYQMVRGIDRRLRLHRIGMLAARGAGIEADAMLRSASTLDIAPTLLARFGLAMPSDGRILPGLAKAVDLRAAVMPAVRAPDGADPAEALVALGYRAPLAPEALARCRLVECQWRVNLAEGLLARRAAKPARQLLLAALEIDADHLLALQHLARCHAMLGQYAEGLALGRRLIEIAPEHPAGHLILGAACALTGAMDDSRPHLAAAWQRMRDDPDLLQQYAGVALLLGAYDDAAGAFRGALALEPNRPDALYGLGIACLGLGDPVAAETHLRRAIAVEYGHAAAHFELSRALSAQLRLQEALFEAALAFEQDPASSEMERGLSDIRQALALAVVAGSAHNDG